MPILDSKMKWRDPEQGGEWVKIFPLGEPDPFTSELKIIEELYEDDTVISPLIEDVVEGSTRGSGKPGLIAKLVMNDFVSVARSSMYQLTQKAGFNNPDLKSITGNLFDVASDAMEMVGEINDKQWDENTVSDIARDLGMSLLGALSSIPNVWVQVGAQLVSTIVMIVDLCTSGNKGEIDDSKLVPLATPDSDHDTVLVQDMVLAMSAQDSEAPKLVVYKSYNDRDRETSPAVLQYTPFFLPMYKGGWKWEWRSENKRSAGVAFQRSTFEGRSEDGSIFTTNSFDGGICFGFMPGAQFCQGEIQTKFTNYFPTTKGRKGWRPNKYNIRSNYKDRLCEYPNGVKVGLKDYQKGKGNYDYDCKHSVGLKSVWSPGPIYAGLHPLY